VHDKVSVMQKEISWKVIDLIKVSGVIAALTAVASIILSFFIESLDNNSTFTTVITFVIQDAILLLPIYFLIIRKYKASAEMFGFINIGFKKTLKYFLNGFGLFILTTVGLALIIGLTQKYFGTSIPGFAQQAEHLPLFGKGKFDLAVAITILIFVAPIIEEFIFRGFLLNTLLRSYKPWIASVITAAVFALIHLEFSSIGIIFILALILNSIFLRSRSLWPCILFHIVNNSLAFSAEYFLR